MSAAENEFGRRELPDDGLSRDYAAPPSAASHDEQAWDQILTSARWPEPTKAEVQAVKRSWDAVISAAKQEATPQTRPIIRSSRVALAVAVAASILVGCAVWMLRHQFWPGSSEANLVDQNPQRNQENTQQDRVFRLPDEQRGSNPQEGDGPPRQAPIVARGDIPTAPQESDPTTKSDGRGRRPAANANTARHARPPTLREAIAFREVQSRRKRVTDRLKSDPVERAVQRLLAHRRRLVTPEADATSLDLGEQLPRDLPTRQQWEQRLLSELPRAKGPRQKAVVQLLDQLATAETFRVLRENWRQIRPTELRQELAPLLARQADSKTLEELLRIEASAEVRREFWHGLFSNPDEETPAILVQLVQQPLTRQECLAGVREWGHAFAEPLLLLLDEGDSQTRRAAAWLLVQIPGEDLSRQLVERVNRVPHRLAYWLAVVPRQDPVISRFRSFVSRNPQGRSNWQIATSTWALFRAQTDPRRTAIEL